MTITVFTPAYNRAYILPKLYESLQRQTIKDFEWLIIDDGSSDNTETIVRPWLSEKQFSVRYKKQKNGGKHIAINNGVMLAKGDLFFIVDSDDYLADNAIERVIFHYSNVKNDPTIGGVCGLRSYPNGDRIGGECNFGIIDCSYFTLRNKLRIVGDMAEVIKTDVMREYPFPVFDDERFCTEALVWDRISDKYKFRYFSEKIYYCEYLNDGLTRSMTKVRMNSPKYATLYYSELFHRNLSLTQKVRTAINYWRFSSCKKNTDKDEALDIGWGKLMAPLGYVMHLMDLRIK